MSTKHFKPQTRLIDYIDCLQMPWARIVEFAQNLKQPLKPQKRLKGRIETAQKLGVYAGKLAMSQAQTKLRGCVDSAVLLCAKAF